jgi:hypothetical protein
VAWHHFEDEAAKKRHLPLGKVHCHLAIELVVPWVYCYVEKRLRYRVGVAWQHSFAVVVAMVETYAAAAASGVATDSSVA